MDVNKYKIGGLMKKNKKDNRKRETFTSKNQIWLAVSVD